MKALIFGPSGSGKTYIAHALQKSGITAYDCDEIEGLSAWYNRRGEKLQPLQRQMKQSLTITHFSGAEPFLKTSWLSLKMCMFLEVPKMCST